MTVFQAYIADEVVCPRCGEMIATGSIGRDEEGTGYFGGWCWECHQHYDFETPQEEGI